MQNQIPELYPIEQIIASEGACYGDLRERLGLDHPHAAEAAPPVRQPQRLHRVLLTAIVGLVAAFGIGFVATEHLSTFSLV